MTPCSHIHYSLQINLPLLTQASRATHSASMDKRKSRRFQNKERTDTNTHPFKQGQKCVPTHAPRHRALQGISKDAFSSLRWRRKSRISLIPDFPRRRDWPVTSPSSTQVIHPKRKIAANRSILRPQPQMCILQASLTFDDAISMLLD